VNLTNNTIWDFQTIIQEAAPGCWCLCCGDKYVGGSAGKPAFYIWPQNGGGNSVAAYCNTVLPTGTWHHVVGVADGTNTYCYLDGVLSGVSPTYTGAIAGSPYYKWIGAAYSGEDSRSWHGLIDDVRIYNRALSAAEILQAYNATATAKHSLLNVNGYITGDGSQLTGITAAQVGVSGVTANIAVLTALPSTFTTLVFTNGILKAVQ
jgi:hypothetical protein